MNLSGQTNSSLSMSSHHGQPKKALSLSKHSLSSSSHHAREANPIKSDGELLLLKGKVNKIQKYKTFQRWKGKFLTRFETFLYEKGMEPAERSASAFDTNLTKLQKQTEKVLDFIHNGDLCADKKSVKASLALNEMCNQLEQSRQEIEGVVPSLKSDERSKGYSKFHLGAALIRQGFHQYTAMKLIEEHIAEIGTELMDVADKQQHDLFFQYKNQVTRFCDVMADLDLYDIMLKCVQFATPPEEDESEEVLPITVIVRLLETSPLTFEDSDGEKPQQDVHSGGVSDDDDDDDDDDPFSTEMDDLIVEKTEIHIELEENDNVKTVHDSIGTAFDIPVHRQIVKFHNKALEDGTKTIDEVGIREGAVLTVQRVLIPIIVRHNSRRETVEMKLRVDPDVYVSDLKRGLESRTNIPAPNQNLYCQPDDKLLDDAVKTLNSYGVVADTVLDLEPKDITVQLEMHDNGRHELIISLRDDTTKSIKEKIQEITGLESFRQSLSLEGKELPSVDSETPGPNAKDMGIQDGDTLTVDILKIPLTVRTWDGKSLDVMVEPSEKISGLKKQLEGLSGIQASNQVLRKADVDLDGEEDSSTVADKKIQAGDQLDLEPKVINVQVESPDGQLHEVLLAPSDTTDDIKKKVEAKTGISIPRQVVSLNGEELPLDGHLKDMGIKEGSSMTVEIMKIPVKVHKWDGTVSDLMVDPTESLLETKQIIDLLNPDAGLAPDNQSIFFQDNLMGDDAKAMKDYGIVPDVVLYLEPKNILVDVETPSGSVHQIALALSNQTTDIKKKAEHATHIAAKRQVLTHKGSKLPDDGKTVKDMGLRHGSHLIIEIHKINVTVETWDGKKIDLKVDPTIPLIEVKQQLELDSEITPSNQALFFHESALDDDTKPLEDYNVEAGSLLRLEPKIVNVKVTMPDGQSHSVPLFPSDDDQMMKEKIEAVTGMPRQSQVVKYKDVDVPRNETVRSMNIREGSNLFVELYKIPITVNTWDDKKIDLLIDPMESVRNTKAILETESGIVASNQALFFEDKYLAEDETSLNTCGLVSRSTLDLEPKVVNVNVQTPDGTQYIVGLAPSDNLDSITSKIESATEVAASRQVVKFKGHDLPSGDTTVKEMGIREGSELVVELSTIPITVNTWDGKSFEMKIDPIKPLSDLKDEVAKQSSIAVDNQVLRHGDDLLTKNGSSIKDNGIRDNAVLYVEPAFLNVTVEMPDTTTHQIRVAPSDDCKGIKGKIADISDLAMPRQVLKKDGSYLPTGKPAKEIGIVDGSVLQVEILRFPVLVNTPDDKQVKIMVEPCETLSHLKNFLEPETGIKSKMQVLTKGENELVGDTKTMIELTLHPNVVVDLKRRDDFIVIVDVYYGTLFGLDREDALSLGVVTLKEGAKGITDFVEATGNARDKDHMKTAMLDSPNLGVKPRIVVEKMDVEEYDVEEAEAVKSKWGVALKKTQKARRGNELLFVDIKHGAVGFLDRKKMENEIKLITPVGIGKDATLQEAEKDAQKYDKFVKEIRKIFGIASL